MNISSIVVQVLPENYDEVKETLVESGKCEYHFGEKEKGKIPLHSRQLFLLFACYPKRFLAR